MEWEYCEIIEDLNETGNTSKVTLVYSGGSSLRANSVGELFEMLYEEGWELTAAVSLNWRNWADEQETLSIGDSNKYLFKRAKTRD